MPLYQPEPPRQIKNAAKTAVLLINLGSPACPEACAVRPYLAEFLSDPRVIEASPLWWKPLLHGVILPLRGRAAADNYRKIWKPDGSPLTVYGQRAAQELAQLLPGSIVRYASTYGSPPIADRFAEFKRQGVARIVVLPLFPQYAASSSGAALDKVFQTLLRQRNLPSLRVIRSFHNHPAYIQAVCGQIQAHWRQYGRGEKLLFSFHGIPQAQYDAGDPYPDECRETARLLAQALDLAEQDWVLAFQSRFGRAKWLSPATHDLLAALPKQGVRRLDVVCPGFVSDCLETLEEIAIAGQRRFIESGGSAFSYIPCLNDNPLWINALAEMVRQEGCGWL